MSLPLLSTKFNLPPTGQCLPRPRLLGRLDESLRQEVLVTLVCAPAGYGKTTVVGEWLRSRPFPFAWLTLERSDDDLARFAAYFAAALQRIRPGIGEGMLNMLQTPRPSPIPVLATLLINELNEIPERFFLVLDDHHLITAEPIHRFISFLVDHQPPQMGLVLITRADPALPLARLRARGQLVELRQSDLRFTSAETAEFVGLNLEEPLLPEQTALLERRTEGWVTGLQLAMLSMRGSRDRAGFVQTFSGTHEFVADYLTDEVLAGLSAPLRAFLLQTSILERLCAPLCEAVTGMAGAQAILEQLREANLFLVPLDDRQEWYRYHVLFADLLRKRLQAAPDLAYQELHRRASRWYGENGMIDLAIEHAIAGEEPERAAALIEQVADRTVMRGEAATLLRWLEALPQEQRQARPALGALYGFVLMACGRPPQAVAALLQEMASGSSPEEMQGEMTTLQALLAVMQGDAPRAVRLAEQAGRQLVPERLFFRSLAADSLGMAYTLAGDIDAAARAFEQVVEIATASDNVMMTIAALTNLAGLRYLRGQLRHAIDTCHQIVDLAGERIGRQTPVIGKTLFTLGEMVREQGDLETAFQYLQEAVRLFEHFSEIGTPLAYLSLARISISRQDWPAAQSYLDTARQGARATQSTRLDDQLAEMAQARLWIARGDLGRAVQWAQERGLLERTPAELVAGAAQNAAQNEMMQGECMTLVRLALAQGQTDRAREIVERLQELNEQKGHGRRLIETLALRALALQQQGEMEQALEVLGRALALAEPEGYQRTFVDEGEPMARLLYQAAARGVFPTYAGRLLKALETEPLAASSAGATEELIEPLSDRELEVLRLIAQGLSNGEIAARLYISLSTVKGHATNIFGKLGVTSRTQAVNRARRLGLLPLA